MPTYGIIGFPLEHSFSPSYFAEKFRRENISGCRYLALPLEDVAQFRVIIEKYPDLQGLNVTVPHKESILPFLDELEETAAEIGAVNTIKFSRGRLSGYNTDAYGFEKSLKPILLPHHNRALVLGTGGAAKAVSHVLRKLGISHLFVSRSPQGKSEISYSSLNKSLMKQHTIIVNCTPVGMIPHHQSSPPLPYSCLSSHHFLYDLVYNPPETVFMQKGKARGAIVKNGLEMLHLQAEKSWEIWKG